jgi:hypothetical protein
MRDPTLHGECLRSAQCGPANLSIRRGNGKWKRKYSSDFRAAKEAKCVFRKSVTGDFGIVTDDFGNVAGDFGAVTDGVLGFHERSPMS